jgi:hypothetical protein
MYAQAEVLDALLSTGCVSLGDTICLSCTNKYTQRSCVKWVAAGATATELLLPAVTAAAAAAVETAELLKDTAVADSTSTLQQQVSWLAKRAPTVLQGDSLTAIMQVPNIPAAVAEVLVRCGARFSWQQLLAAVRGRVQGLEVWPVVSRALRVPLDAAMPRIAAEICCGVQLSEAQCEVRQVDDCSHTVQIANSSRASC